MKRQSPGPMFNCYFFYQVLFTRATMALSDFTHGRIVGLWEVGMNDIAHRIECNERTVRKLIN